MLKLAQYRLSEFPKNARFKMTRYCLGRVEQVFGFLYAATTGERKSMGREIVALHTWTRKGRFASVQHVHGPVRSPSAQVNASSQYRDVYLGVNIPLLGGQTACSGKALERALKVTETEVGDCLHFKCMR